MVLPSHAVLEPEAKGEEISDIDRGFILNVDFFSPLWIFSHEFKYF